MAKRENNSFSIKDLMGSFIQENNLKKGFQKMHIEEAWEKLMGAGVASYTSEVKLQNGTLIVRLTSSVLREELSYGKEKIINMLNHEMGEDLVKRLMLV
ncbi:RNA-binding protein [Tenacibaculum sp. 190130A14a]|uniref:RNA-binding protein n=1 Tax=Tenacibaculum polynesiense TaxID=3137857 RepID=A0ABM9P8D6_9FLAO